VRDRGTQVTNAKLSIIFRILGSGDIAVRAKKIA
jgi:hypothetical protein